MADPTRTPQFATPVYLAPPPGAKQQNITTDTNTLIKTGAGTIYGFTVNTAGATSTLKLYDGIDATGTLLGTFDTTVIGNRTVGFNVTTGIFAVTAGGTPADLTVSYQ